jgi:lipopolysaccharide/colanic/teichoic acid biosynthesis glycosyltransferase
MPHATKNVTKSIVHLQVLYARTRMRTYTRNVEMYKFKCAHVQAERKADAG